MSPHGPPEFIPLEEAAGPLDVDLSDYLTTEAADPPATSVELMAGVRPAEPITAALSSRPTCTARAAWSVPPPRWPLDTTGPRDDVLPNSWRAPPGRPADQGDRRIGVARVDPAHDVLRNVIGRRRA